MDNKTLKKFKNINSVIINGYHSVGIIYEFIKKNNFTFSDFYHHDMKYYPKKFESNETQKRYILDKNNWITYDSFRRCKLIYCDDKDIIIEVVIRDSRIDSPCYTRWSVKLKLSIDVINNDDISEYIDLGFRNYLSNCYEEFLLEQRDKWIEKMEKKLLK